LRRLLIALPLFLLAACGGSGSGGSGPDGDAPRDDGPAIGVLTGRVVEAVADAPLANVSLTLTRVDGNESVPATGTSAADGSYLFDTLPIGGRYRIDYALESYRTESYTDIVIVGAEEEAATRTLEPVRLVSNDNAGSGSLAGAITSAVDGAPLGGLLLEFRRGINARTGEIVATARTAADGSYAVTGLEYGNLTCIITGDGFATTYTTVVALGGVDRIDQDAAVSPRVDTGDTRIVLTWGERPTDLDAHLTGPGAAGEAPFRVYFADKQADVAVLDLDDTSSFGPETVTVDASRSGTFRYSVYNFSGENRGRLAESSARVQVLRPEGVVADFFVPRGDGNLWTVFDLIDGEILPVNTMSSRSSNDDHFAPETLR